MQVSEEVICSLLRQKKLEGLEMLFDAYYRPLVLWADTFLNHMQHSEDLVQDFFIKLWEKELYLKLEPGKTKAYLYTAVRNQALNRVSLQDPLRRAYDINSFSKAWEEYDNHREAILRKVEHEISKLPEQSRKIVHAVYIQGKRYKEVAEEFGISVATVKTLLVHSLRRLREESKKGNWLLFYFFICRLGYFWLSRKKKNSSGRWT